MAGNKWISFLKSWRARHKGVSMKDSMKKAAVDYRKQKGKNGNGNGKEEKKKTKKRR